MSAYVDEAIEAGGLPRQEDAEETTEKRKMTRVTDPLKPSAKEVE